MIFRKICLTAFLVLILSIGVIVALKDLVYEDRPKTCISIVIVLLSSLGTTLISGILHVWIEQ